MPNAHMLKRLSLLALLGACQGEKEQSSNAATQGPVVVFAAGSLARPMRAALDSFTAATGIPYTLESAGSLELARKFTDLGKGADILALADEDVFPKLLMPEHVAWYARFARNRLVLAYSASATGLDEAKAGAWRRVLTRPGVEVGRADPDLDPAGYRTLLLFQLAERFYGEPGLAAKLEAYAPRMHVRPKSAELVALLQAGELDYAWMYESAARGARLSFLALPPEVDLGRESMAAHYDSARVRVLGARMGDTIDVRGTPIRYGLSIPRRAEHAAAAESFLRFLFSAAGRRALRGEFLDVIDTLLVVGEQIPAAVLELAAPVAGKSVPDSAPSD